MLHVEIEIDTVKQKGKPKKTNPVLQEYDVIEYLKICLSSSWQSGKNIAIICMNWIGITNQQSEIINST